MVTKMSFDSPHGLGFQRESTTQLTATGATYTFLLSAMEAAEKKYQERLAKRKARDKKRRLLETLPDVALARKTARL